MPSSFSFVSYTGNGTTQTFNVPFQYISQAHVEVYIDGTLRTTGISWDSASTIRLNPAPASGAEVRISRNTPKTVALVDFQDAGILTESSLDLNTRQGLLIVQEAFDEASNVISAAVAAAVAASQVAGRSVPTVSPSDIGRLLVGRAADSYGWSSNLSFNEGTGVLTASGFAGPLTGNVTGNLTGNVTGNLAGNVTGNLAGNVTGNVTGNLAGAAQVTVSTAGTSRLLVENTKATFSVDTVVPSLNGGALAGMRNLIINGNPVINQRGYVSGTATTVANQYTLDRWRVVVSGQSLSWTDSAGIRTVIFPAGGGEQVIEAANNLGGVHTLSWTGTATATVNGTSVANGGQVTLTGNTDVTIRMSGGSGSMLQLEQGPVATPFERRHHGQERTLCERYFCAREAHARGSATGAGVVIETPVYWQTTMRAVPTLSGPVGGASGNVSSVNATAPTARSCRFSISSAAAGDFYSLGGLVSASAEL